MNNRHLLLTSLLLLLTLKGTAQISHDIISLDTRYFFGKIKVMEESATPITNRDGFDNHPKFINDSQLVFSSEIENGNKDIMMYNFETGKFTNLTKTPDKNEYFPSLTDCGLYVSTVTEEQNGDQKIWLYPINMGEPELLYDDISPVGSYDWYNNIAAMEVMGENSELIYPYSKGEVKTLAKNIGKSVNRRPKTSEITFIDKSSNVVVDGVNAYEINSYDIETGESGNKGIALSESEHFVWLDKNNILMAKGNDIFIRNINRSLNWNKIATINLPGYDNISCLAVSPKKDKLVFVMERVN